ncbi:LacI family DNA-binding transcriptional regulator [Camelliibacillus cellulosilyticus]|uniref:LacI family DNA-binding transcriptional regulator n=1 Tax=Camelliibacillus cellulosilyticus TaxID=2174486 RepID=A0ABV9GK85_9BACL
MTTIYDIAKKAGVSAATVSKVLNGRSDVGAKTVERVKRISKELGYQPSSMAKGLATKKTHTIGIFFQDHLNSGFRHPFLQDILASFKDVIGANGYDLLFFAKNVPTDGDESFETLARQRNVDGLMLLGVPRTNPGLTSLAQSGIPCISIDLDLLGPRAGYLISNNIGGAMKAVDYLVEMGHRDIAFICDMFKTKPGLDRLVGYREALQKHNIPVRSKWIVNGDFSEAGGYYATKKLLMSKDQPSAIFCAGDLMAIGAMRAMREQDLRVGEDISLIGFDDITLLKYVHPGLTTIRQNKDEMGKQAAFELMKLMNDPNHFPSTITLETELIVRDTVIKRDVS